MSKIVAFETVSLDGVMQGPGRPDEDRRGGFEHGGWAVPYTDETLGQIAGQGMGNSGGMLMGRRTYEDLLSLVNAEGQSFHGRLAERTKVRGLDDAHRAVAVSWFAA